MYDPPSDAQIDYLDRLHYEGEPPLTKKEASLLIEAVKFKMAPHKMEASLLKHRKQANREWWRGERSYVRQEIGQAVDACGAIAGFRIQVGKRCKMARKYHGAFVPTQIAAKYPQTLPPYEGICQHWSCECEFEDLLEDDRIGRDTPMVVGPDKITTVRKWRKRPKSSFASVLVLAFVLYMIYIAYKAVLGF